MNKSNEFTRHEVREVVCDYGVYAQYLFPDPHEELLVICNSRKNADLIRLILDFDSLKQDCSEIFVEDILDAANGNVLGYIDDRYHPKKMSFNGDGIKAFHVDIDGLGRFSKPDKYEVSALRSLKATDEIVITRKIGPIELWSVTI